MGRNGCNLQQRKLHLELRMFGAFFSNLRAAKDWNKLPREIVKSVLGNIQTMTGQDPMQPHLTLLFFGEGEWVLIKRTPETLPNLNQSMCPSSRSLLTNKPLYNHWQLMLVNLIITSFLFFIILSFKFTVDFDYMLPEHRLCKHR